MKNNKKELALAIVGVLGLVLITLGVSYSFFNYARTGSKDNVINTGKITFVYDEKKATGNGIQLVDALPVSDSTGMGQTDANKYFDFKVVANTTASTSISYDITVRKSETDTTLDDKVKLYLTSTDESPEDALALGYYSGFETVTHNGYTEKKIYTGIVHSNDGTEITNNFRLRMWLAEKDANNADVDFSPVPVTTPAYCTENTNNTTVPTINDAQATAENCTGDDYTWHPAVTTDTYPLSGKTFTIHVNVYASGVEGAYQYSSRNVEYTNASSQRGCTDMECSLNELEEIFG